MAGKKTRNFGDVIRAKLAENPDLAQAVEDEAFNADIAQQVHDLRTEAGLTQKQLADLVGTQQSAISRIEDADYDGHSLAMLRRIAKALNRQLKVDFCAKPIYVDACTTEFTPAWPALEAWQLVAGITAKGAVPIVSGPIKAAGAIPDATFQIDIAGAVQAAPALSGPFEVLFTRLAPVEAIELTKKT